MQGLIQRLLRDEKKSWPHEVVDDLKLRGVKCVSSDPKGLIIASLSRFYNVDEAARKVWNNMLEWQKLMATRGNCCFWFMMDGDVVFVTRQLDSSTQRRSSSEWPKAMSVFVVDESDRTKTRLCIVPVPQPLGGEVDEGRLENLWDSIRHAASSDDAQECPICFVKKLDEVMFTLTSCSHVICNDCLDKLPCIRRYAETDKVKCPTCRIESAI